MNDEVNELFEVFCQDTALSCVMIVSNCPILTSTDSFIHMDLPAVVHTLAFACTRCALEMNPSLSPAASAHWLIGSHSLTHSLTLNQSVSHSSLSKSNQSIKSNQSSFSRQLL
jgi:hypothetical protein